MYVFAFPGKSQQGGCWVYFRWYAKAANTDEGLSWSFRMHVWTFYSSVDTGFAFYMYSGGRIWHVSINNGWSLRAFRMLIVCWSTCWNLVCLRICSKWRICFCRNVDFMEIFSEDTLVFWHLEKYWEAIRMTFAVKLCMTWIFGGESRGEDDVRWCGFSSLVLCLVETFLDGKRWSFGESTVLRG